jgi:O-antigen/teichoic acid export membrane protein
MASGSSRVIRDVFVIGAGRGMLALAGLVTVRVATDMLTPETMGYVAQTASLVALLASIVVVPVGLYVGRGFLGWLDSGVARRQLTRFLGFVAAAAVASALLVLIVRSNVSIIEGMSAASLATLTLIYVFGFPLQTAGAACLNLLGRRISYVAFGNLAVWGGLAFAVGLFHYFSSPEAWMFGLYFGYVAAAFAFLLVMGLADKSIGSGAGSLPFTVGAVFLFAWPQVLTAVLWWIQSQSYRFVLGEVDGPALVGLFAAGYTVCAGTMQAFETLFHELYTPKLYRSLADRGQSGFAQAWNDYASAYLPAVVLFGAFLVGMTPYLAKVLLAEQYREMVPVLFLPAVAETLRAMGSALHTMGVAKLDMRILVVPVLVGAILSPVLVYVLGSIDPLLGTALGMFLAYLGVFLVVIPISRRALPIRWPVGRILVAALAGLPVIILGQFLPLAIDVTLAMSLLVLAIGVVYLGGAQFILARSWLGPVGVRFGKRTK